MAKALGLAFVLVLSLAIPAAAEQVMGTVTSIDTANQSIVLDDGTRLWVSEGSIGRLSLGDRVLVTYETKGDRKVVTQMARRTTGLDGNADSLHSVQAGDN